MSKSSSVSSSRGALRGVSPRRGIFKGVSPLNGGFLRGSSPLGLGNALANRRLLPKIFTPPSHIRRLISAPVKVERKAPMLSDRLKICKDRHERREVLFAMKKTGSNSSHSSKKYTINSFVRC